MRGCQFLLTRGGYGLRKSHFKSGENDDFEPVCFLLRPIGPTHIILPPNSTSCSSLRSCLIEFGTALRTILQLVSFDFKSSEEFWPLDLIFPSVEEEPTIVNLLLVEQLFKIFKTFSQAVVICLLV